MEFSSRDFEKAFQKAALSTHKKQMLINNYQSPKHTITAKQMARSLGYKHHGPANLHYGTLAKKIGNILEIKTFPKENIEIIVDLFRDNNEWHWVLKPQVCEALENLNWVNHLNEFSFPAEIEGVETFTEGHVKIVSVNTYERCTKARKACIEHYGTACQVCSMDFEKTYGQIGEGYIHVHHKMELSLVRENYQVNPITDLIPVCPNCHAMLHQRKPAYSVEELKKFLAQ